MWSKLLLVSGVAGVVFKNKQPLGDQDDAYVAATADRNAR